MIQRKLLLFRTLIHFFVVIIVFFFSTECFAYKGALGASIDTGYAGLTGPDNLVSPNRIHGVMGRLRAFYGFTDAIGLECKMANSFFSGYTPVVWTPATLDSNDPQKLSLTEVKRTQIRQVSIGLIYVIDVYKVIPYFSVGVTKMYTGTRNIKKGAINDDVAAYVDGALEYQFSKNVWGGLVGSFFFPISSNSQFGGHMGVLLRLTYVWHTQKLNLTQKTVE